MAFPRTPLPVRVRIAPGADPAGNPATYNWVEITNDVRIANNGGIDIEVGRQDEGKKVDGGKATLTINNKGGHYSPRCAIGRWYGLLAKNTPIDIAVRRDVVDPLNRTAASNWGATPDGDVWKDIWTDPASSSSSTTAGAVHTVTKPNTYRYSYLPNVGAADVDMYATCAVNQTAAGDSIEPLNLMLRVTDITTYYLFRVRILSNNAVNASIYDRSGNVLAGGSLAGFTYTAGTQLRVRAQAIGQSLRLKVWPASQAEPATWTIDTFDTGYVGVGGIGIRSGIASAYTGGIPVVFTYTNMSATLWCNRFDGTVPEWPPRWDKSGRDAWVSIQAAGILRRLSQGQSPLRSVIYRSIVATSPVAYWSLEDAAQASSFADYAGGPPMYYYGTAPTRASGGPPGSAPVITLAADTSLAANVAWSVSKNEWGVEYNLKMPDAGGQDYPLIDTYCDGDISRVQVLYGFNSGGEPLLALKVFFPNGTSTQSGWFSGGVVFPDDKFHGHDIMMAIHAYPAPNNPGHVRVDGAWSSPDFKDKSVQAYLLPSLDVAGSATGRVTRIEVNSGNGYPRKDWQYGHIGVWNGISAQAWGSLVGNTGETAHSRVTRLCKEEGILLSSDPGQYSSQQMGPQPIDTFLNIVRECETTDASVIYERGYGLAYQPRTYRHSNSAPVVMTLDFAAGDVSDPPEPTDDDQFLRNDVTVSRKGGSSFRTQVTTGPNRINLVGRYGDSVDLSLATDDQLANQSGWRAHLGTNNDVRWPKLPINLAARPGLIPQWLACRPGARINVLHPPVESGAGSTLDLFIEGYTEHIGAFEWTVDANCSPASQWYVFVLDSDRLDADASSVLTAGIDATVVTFQVSTSSQPGAAWTTNAAEWTAPKTMYIDVEGEQMQVTNIAGSSSPQTFTVIRSVNGVVKSHNAGVHVGLWQPRVLAL